MNSGLYAIRSRMSTLLNIKKFRSETPKTSNSKNKVDKDETYHWHLRLGYLSLDRTQCVTS